MDLFDIIHKWICEKFSLYQFKVIDALTEPKSIWIRTPQFERLILWVEHNQQIKVYNGGLIGDSADYGHYEIKFNNYDPELFDKLEKAVSDRIFQVINNRDREK